MFFLLVVGLAVDVAVGAGAAEVADLNLSQHLAPSPDQSKYSNVMCRCMIYTDFLIRTRNMYFVEK